MSDEKLKQFIDELTQATDNLKKPRRLSIIKKGNAMCVSINDTVRREENENTSRKMGDN